MLIIKRNKSIEEFNKEKIETAILKAMKFGIGNVNVEVAKEIADKVAKCFGDDEMPTVEQIENIVYYELVREGYEHIAKAYEGYRAVQEFKRQKNTTFNAKLKYQ